MMQAGVCDRSGPGVQQWTEGSRYEGEFRNGLKHGNGTFTWPNRECYKGSFYKDNRHGRGTYFWPDGSQFMGKFYLNHKEGYGIHLFPDGTIFKGLYHANERLGPGVMSYPNARQDVGLWYHQWLLRFCTSVKGGFTLMYFPEHMARLPQQHRKQIQSPPSLTMETCIESHNFLTSDTYLGDFSCVENEKFILPPGIESYSTDSDHLPIPRFLRQKLDLHFFERDNISKPLFSSGVPLLQRMEAHIQTHSFEVEELDWNVADVLAMTRDHFGSKGPLELRSESLINEASLGNLQNVQNILSDQKVHPDVGDVRGQTALIAATVSCHDNVINLLLDNGADINKLNYEGMSALAVCSVLYYPFQSLQESVAEKTSQDITTELKISESSTLANSTQETAAKKRPKDEVYTELPGTETQINQVESEECSTAQTPETPKHAEEIKITSKDKEVSQQTQNEQGRVVEAKLLDETKPLKEKILEDPSDWHQDEDEGENIISAEKDETTYRNKSPEKDHGYDLASPVDSFHIQSTEATMEQMATVLCETILVSPAETQDTVNRIAVIKLKNEVYWAIMKLLLERGADPNMSVIPMPVMFLAIKAGHVDAVQRLLESGARTDLHLTAEQKGLYPLHVAAGLTGPAGPKITKLLLQALADPDVKAQDASEVYKLDKISKEEMVAGENMPFRGYKPPTNINNISIKAPNEGGRTPLHVACQKDTDYENARDVVALLLSHKANTNHLWSGHSPLSLAIASGNDLAVDELLGAGADPNLPLTGRVGNALCAAINIYYSRHTRIKLVEKLLKAGADILMPVLIGERGRGTIGTALDYAHYMFNKDWRIAHTPYHALKQSERELYNARCQLITMMAEHMRQAATSREKQRIENEKSQGIYSVSQTDKFVFTRTGATPPVNALTVYERSLIKGKAKTGTVRKPLFKYCYQCGRSAWVVLTPCSRCHEVFYCSKACKLKGWNERHKQECVRVPGSGRPMISHMSSDQRCRLSSKFSRKGNVLNLSKAESHTFTHQYYPEENYSFN